MQGTRIDKRKAAAITAVLEYLAEESEAAKIIAAVSPCPSEWAMSGRRRQMEMRALLQARLWK